VTILFLIATALALCCFVIVIVRALEFLLHIVLFVVYVLIAIITGKYGTERGGQYEIR
jgi:hypothetical protein